MIYDGDIDKAKNLALVAKRVINKGSSIRHEAFEKRVQLWNEIRQNQECYENGECGRLLDDLDNHYRAMYDFALLILRRSFIENNDDFPASNIFSEVELEIHERIQKYDVFEISTKQDIKKRVIAKDRELLDLLKEYYSEMDGWVEGTVDNSDIRLTLRYYLRKTWGGYKQKVNDALNDLIRDYDWIRVMIRDWENQSPVSPEPEIPAETPPVEEPVTEEEETGSRFIDRGEAKFYESNFTGRIKNKLHMTREFLGKHFKLEDIKEYSNADVSKFADTLNDGSLRNLPDNKYVIARLVKKRWFKKKTIIVKAMFCCRIKRYALNGFDTFPLELEDINPCISDGASDMINGRMLLCIASPTGFSQMVHDHIAGKEFHRNYLSTVSVCLVDLETGEMIRNPHDTMAKDFKDLFTLEVDEEQIAKAKKLISERLIESGSVRLDDFMKRHDFTRQIAKKAFYDLEKEKEKVNVEYCKDFGTLWLWRE